MEGAPLVVGDEWLDPLELRVAGGRNLPAAPRYLLP
ncbi:hypothetical protein Pla163_07830 [Planctomycetes bacterium Pla163]|uniref:Uncharacterized protein n=1 Tax=Rohdeia mirabilis TaxID=2528008 RepID=A0A518CWR9_9BACT|nr:hypothetical protein Pla163_07830 [Planctomycetes bacterium Pla163]